MRTVHRLSPLKEEAFMAVPPRVKPAAQLQHAPSGNKGSSNPESSLLFSLDVEDGLPSKALERLPSVASGPATSTAAVVDTLQLLLAPASDGEAMLHVHIRLAQDLAAAHAAAAAEGDALASGSGPAAPGAAATAESDPDALHTEPSYSGGSSTDDSSASRHGGGSAAASGSGSGSGGAAGSSRHSALRRLGSSTAQLDAPSLAETFSRLGYSTRIRSSALKLAHRRGLQHQYLTVHVPDNDPRGGESFIVDPAFRDQFVVANPTPRYAAVLAALTPHVVATKAVLRQVVMLLCGELAACFEERDHPIPPWRTPAALLARWNLQQPADGAGGSGS